MKMSNDGSLDFALLLQKDGAVCLSRGDNKRAKHLYSQAHSIILARVGSLHRLVAESLLNLGAIYCVLGVFRKAQEQFLTALKLLDTLGLGDDPLYMATNTKLADIFIADGKVAEAESIYRNFLVYQLDQPKTNYSAVAAIRTELAHLYAEQGKMEKSLAEINYIRKNHDCMIESISSSQRCEQSSNIEHARLAYYFALSINLRYFKDSAEAVQAMALYTFRRKTLQMEFEFSRQQLLIKSTNESRSGCLKELDRVRERLTNNTLSFPRKPENSDIHYRQLQNDESQRQQLEERLDRMLSETSVINWLDSINLDEIFESLSNDEMLIEFVRYRHYDFAGLNNRKQRGWKEYRYLAFVLKADSLKSAQFFDLGDAETIDRLVNLFHVETCKKFSFSRRGLIANDDETLKADHQSGIALRQLVFDPLVRNCARGSSLILVPDGLLWKIPFEALSLDEGTGYLMDQFNIRYINSGRELIKDQEVNEKISSEPLIVTDKECNKQTCMEPKGFSLKSGTVRWSKSLSFFTCQKRDSQLEADNISSDSRFDIDDDPFEVLSGARVEAETVARLLDVSVQNSLKAKKTLFQKGVSPRILHFATHGLFLPRKDSSRSKVDRFEKLFSKYVPIDNPMLRSAVLLTDKQFNQPDPISAEQILSLDLRATELVVLSACDSGLGEIKNGEGVFGLRRAFMLVGAKAVVMSLWQVADLPTTLLMIQFYRNLTQKCQCIHDSLRDAQRYLKRITISELHANCHTDEIIETLCTRDQGIRQTVDWYNQQPQSYRPFEAPFYWGGFICVGKSTSLIGEK